MHVLVLDTDGRSGGEVQRRLEDAGHRVHRCHPVGSTDLSCVALDEPSACPLEGCGVGVTVVVRTEESERASPFEDGVACSVRRHIPVVVAGTFGDHPFRAWAVSTVEGTDEVVEVSEQAAAAPLVRHERAALRTLRHLLADHGFDAGRCAVSVHRHEGTVVVVLHAAGLDARLRSLACARVAVAIRAFDRHTPRLELGVVDRRHD